MAGYLPAPAATALAVGLFAPGTLAAKTIGRLKASSPSKGSLLSLLEANLLAPPTAATGADHVAVRIAGAESGSLDLPLNAVGTHFKLEPTPAVTLKGEMTVSLVTVGTGGVPGSDLNLRIQFAQS